ncbi:MAG TPA: hypothetical protein PLO65_00480 [Caulobacter sp.]|nr:hypothetical protein [Caulobacter sp.]
MENTSLDTFVAAVRSAWGPLTSELVTGCSRALEAALKAPPAEPWLAALHRDRPANAELHRDPALGFVLLAHTEQAGLYRPPHDHGRSWVVYAIQQGEIEMGSYVRIENPDGEIRLVERDRTVLRAGQVKAYLPGDIHDTRCLSPSALLFRFTERDLKVEDLQEHRVTRYVRMEGGWSPGRPR